MNKVLAMTAAVLALTAGGLVSAGSASASVAAPFTVNFTGDATGAKANGFHSASAPQVFFYDTVGADLYLADFGDQSHGQAIAVHNDDASALEIRLGAPTNAISLAFGNDDASVVNSSDQAELKLYRNATLVSQVDVNVNANDKMDQTIGIANQGLFNRATFQYVDASGNPKNLIEIVDDITVNPLCTIVGTSGSDHIVGTAGNDVICGDTGADAIYGGNGDDLIYAGAGADLVHAGNGKDVVYGGKGRDELYGDKGKDVLNGDKGRDDLNGNTGRDQLNGGTGRDSCDGGKGHDTQISCEVLFNIP
jgi:Ca2+-binding RTX toxin-like protein